MGRDAEGCLMGSEAYDPALRPQWDVGTEPSITLVGRAKPRTGDESEKPTNTSDVIDNGRQEPPERASRLTRCEHPGCPTMIAPGVQDPWGKPRTLCSQHWTEARRRGGIERKKSPATLHQMIRRAFRPD